MRMLNLPVAPCSGRFTFERAFVEMVVACHGSLYQTSSEVGAFTVDLWAFAKVENDAAERRTGCTPCGENSSIRGGFMSLALQPV